MEKERYFIHFKGGMYKMLGIAQHSETLEEMVVYQALYGKHEIWVRPKTMFFDKVVRNGIKMDRFKEITENALEGRKVPVVVIFFAVIFPLELTLTAFGLLDTHVSLPGSLLIFDAGCVVLNCKESPSYKTALV